MVIGLWNNLHKNLNLAQLQYNYTTTIYRTNIDIVITWFDENLEYDKGWNMSKTGT